MHKSWGACLLCTVAIGALLSGCTGQDTSAEERPTTLKLLHVDGGPGLDPAVEWFTQRVNDLSEGDIKIDVAYSCCGEGNDIEEQLVNRVADGRGDLGWVGTRVFDELGVTGLRALTAPMLIDSYPLEQAVIGSDLVKPGLRELEPLGVRGLALVPGALRKPLSSAGPVLAPADWAGKKVVAFHSRLNADSLKALGATPLDLGFEARDQGLFDGSIQATENTLAFQNGNREQILPYAAVNVSLWPRISALIANPDRLASLGKSRVDVLMRAAADTAARTGDLADTDTGMIEANCKAGARFAEASPAQLAELTTAFAPVYQELGKDPVTKNMLDGISSLKETVQPGPALAIPSGCRGPAPTKTDNANPTAGDTSVLNGSFRRGPRSVAQLIGAGMSAQGAENAAGTFTFVFENGRFELIADWYKGGRFGCTGSYTIDGDRVTVDYLPGGDCGPGGEYFNATFERRGKVLQLTDVDAPSQDDRILIGGTWDLIG